LGYRNNTSGLNSSAVGFRNITAKTASNAIGSRNEASGTLSNAIGSGVNNTALTYNGNGEITSIDGIAITTTAKTIATLSSANISAFDGNASPTTNQKNAFINTVSRREYCFRCGSKCDWL
jgi:hypothetical protein